jgi:phosphate-selective porin OprO and OprP
MSTFIADMVFKYQGWALSAEYFERTSPDPVTVSSEGAIRASAGRGRASMAS